MSKYHLRHLRIKAMDKLLRGIINERKIIIFLLVILVIFGAYAYYIIPKKENPESALPAAMITTMYPGASPMDVETMVTEKIEDSLSDLPGIDYISSISLNSASIVVIIFDVDIDWETVSATMRSNISDLQADLPEMSLPSQIKTDLIEAAQFIISLSGDNFTQEDLAQYGADIKRTLERIEGVTRVDVEGLLDRQVNVVTDISLLDLYNISIEDVLNLLLAQNLTIPSGAIKYESGEINVNTPATFSSLRDIENLVIGGSTETIGFVKLKDIAKISIDYTEGYKYKHNGKNAILLSGYMDPEKNAVIIGHDVRETLDELKKQLPEGISFEEIMYSPQDIDDSVNSFIMNLGQSILLIIIVVMLGVKLRNGLVVSAALPLSIFATFIVMLLLKIEFQFISIAALIISLGILVDNAIVISEAIQHYIDTGIDKTEAIIMAVKETATPVFTSTLTTIITFGILYFIPGAIGSTVSTIPTVVITALLASYIVAMVIIPVFAYMFFKPTPERKRLKHAKHNTLKRAFLKMLSIGLRFKKTALLSAFLLLALSCWLVLGLGMSFFPYSDKPVIYLNATGETLNLNNTEKITDKIHAILDEHPFVKDYTTAIGKPLPRFFLTVPSRAPADNFAQIMLKLDLDAKPGYDDNEKIGRSLQNEFDTKISGADIEVKYLEYSIPMDAKIVIKLMGDDLEMLHSTSLDVQDALGQIDGAVNIRDDYVPANYEYVVKLDAELLSTMGLIKYDVVKQINTALMGASASTYVAGGSEMNIIVSADINSLDDLFRLPISSSITSSQILLEQLAKIDMQSSIPTIINHYTNQADYAQQCHGL